LVLTKGGRNTTLIQASIANNGNSVILIADRLLTSRIGRDETLQYEFEWNQEKIFYVENVGVGFAGAAIFADKAEKEVRKKSKNKDLTSIINAISKYIKNEKKEIINQFIFNETGIASSAEFFTKVSLPIPEPVRGSIYTYISELSNMLNFACIVCGFDKNNHCKLVAIDNDGKIYDMTNFGSVQIGSGDTFSRIYFDLNCYKTSVSLSEGLFFAYKAKKWAEAPTGVGYCTDIFILQKNEKPLLITDDSPLMNKINSIHKEELENHNETKNKLIKKIENILKDVKK